MNLYRKCIQSLLSKSCGSSWWELYKVKFVRGTIFAVVVTSHPNIVQFRFPIILPASKLSLTQGLVQSKQTVVAGAYLG